MIQWKEYSRFSVIGIGDWNEDYEKKGWAILQFFVEDSDYSNSQIQQGQTYTIDTATHITFPVATNNVYTSHHHKFLIGYNKAADVLFKKGN